MFRSVSFLVRSKLYNRIIVPFQPKQNSRGKKRQYRHDPLFFLWSRNTAYVPQLSISHKVVFQRLKLFDNLRTPSAIHQELVEEHMFSMLDPPDIVRGMKKLDRSLFEKTVKVKCVCVPVEHIKRYAGLMSKFKLKMPNISPVVNLESTDPKFRTHKLLLLNPLRPFDTKEDLDGHEADKIDTTVEEYELKLTYDNWDFPAVVDAILPEDLKVAAFTVVGHIAHFNLRDEVLPYKHLIGEVLLDKLRNVKTVVNKLDTIDNTYRNFKMELLAGEDNLLTQTKENGCTFELDFSKVYWNSRLNTEHERVVRLVQADDIVFDVFAGIGPFAIPAAKKGAVVYANDLNPSSYDSLLKNVKLNKIKVPVSCYNLDGREFIQTVVMEELQKFYLEKCKPADSSQTKVHIIMNLPAIAVTFLDAFDKLFGDFSEIDLSNVKNLPSVYCYCFTNMEEAQAKWGGDLSLEVKQRVVGVVGSLTKDAISLRFVRNVAPNKDMMCVTFQLTPEILCGKTTAAERKTSDSEVTDEPPQKVMKTGNYEN